MPKIQNADEVESMFNLFVRIDLPAVGVDITQESPVIDRVNEPFKQEFGVEDAEGECVEEFTADCGNRLFKRIPQPAVILSDDMADVDLFRYRSETYIRTRIAGRDYVVDAFFHADTDIPHHQYLILLKRVFRHNLRNRTSEILGWAKLLEKRSDNTEFVEKAAENIIEQSNRLNHLSDETRRLQRLLDLDGEVYDVDLSKMVANVVASYDEYDEGLIDVNIRSDIEVLANQRLRIVIDYLVENAFDHNDDVEVEIEAFTDTNRYVVLKISDTGTGLPSTEQDIVTGVYDIDEVNHSQGIGLWIVRWVLKEYYAEVEVDASEGDGTTYRIKLPH